MIKLNFQNSEPKSVRLVCRTKPCAFLPQQQANKFLLNLSSFAVLVIASSFLLLGCQTSPKKFSDFHEGEWQGKILIRDKLAHKSGILNVKAAAIDTEKLRLDVTSPFGTHVASFLLVGSNFESIIIAEKTYYKSQSNREALKSVLKIPLDPEVFYNLLFDRTISSKSWSCLNDDKGIVKECREKKSGIGIVWSNRSGDKRTIEVENSAASLQMNLYGFENKINDPEKSFQLKAPASFKVKNL